MVSYVLWGIGFPMAVVTLGVYFHRLTMHKLPPREVIITVFMPVGPLGQASFTIMNLGKMALDLFPEVRLQRTLAHPQVATDTELDRLYPPAGRWRLLHCRFWHSDHPLGIRSCLAGLCRCLCDSLQIPLQHGVVGIHLPNWCLCPGNAAIGSRASVCFLRHPWNCECKPR